MKNRLSGEARDDSDGSSDSSEDDLDSPRVIRSAPASSSSGVPTVVAGAANLASTEKMDVDSSGAHFYPELDGESENFQRVPGRSSLSFVVFCSQIGRRILMMCQWNLVPQV